MDDDEEISMREKLVDIINEEKKKTKNHLSKKKMDHMASEYIHGGVKEIKKDDKKQTFKILKRKRNS